VQTDITVFGAGNTGFPVAANLSLAGFSVSLAELPEFREAIDPVREAQAIELRGVARVGVAKIAMITDDVAAAVAASDTLLVIVPAYAHAPWARAIAPYIEERHTLTLMPGTLGSLEVHRIFREAGAPPIPVAETDTSPYVCRKTGPAETTIFGVVPRIGLGVFPASQTGRVHELLTPLFPGIERLPDVLYCGLSAMNPIVHPPGVLMNAGRIEHSRGEFYFYDEGVTRGVVSAIMALDAERRAVAAALGHDLPGAAEAFHRAGFGPRADPPDLWATINGSEMLTALKAPGQLNTRWLSEDVPYGLRAWAGLGAMLDVPTPVINACVALGLTVLGEPLDTNRRTMMDLGLDGMSRDAMLDFVAGASS